MRDRDLGEPRQTIDFLVERLFDVRHSEEAERARKQAVDTLIEMSGEFEPEVVARLVKACGNVAIDSESVEAAWRVFANIEDKALIRARRQMEELIRLKGVTITGYELLYRVKEVAAVALGKVRENNVLVDGVVDVLGEELLREVNPGIVQVLGTSRNLKAKRFLEQALVRERERSGLAEEDIEDVEKVYRALDLRDADRARHPIRKLEDAIEQLKEDLSIEGRGEE